MSTPSGSKRPGLRHTFRVVPLKDERLDRKVALAFGFMSFIPLLLMVWALFSVVFPNVRGAAQESLRWLIVGIIGSIFIGYFVLKRTTGAVIKVVNQARKLLQQQIGQTVESTNGDEIGELAKTFNRITQELENKIAELESSRSLIKRLLSRIGTALVSYEGIDNLITLILENASVALEAQMSSLMLVNGEKQELEVKTLWSANGERLSARAMKLGEGIAGWVAKEGAPMRGTCSPGAVGLTNGHPQEGAVLCVPLMIRDKTIGIMSVLREDANRQFTEEDELLLTNIGSQVAVAIENYRLNLDMERTYFETVMALAMAVEAKEPYTGGHTKRVAYYATLIGEAMGVDDGTMKTLQHAGILHDVGKIGIKDDILLKPGALTPEEFRIMQQHSVIGEAILKPVQSLRKVAELVRHHHERYDGTGYPDGLKGEAIPLAARILTVSDSYDAMVTDRPYRKRLSLEQAKEELRKGAGKQFDPNAIDAFLTLLAQKETKTAPAPTPIV